MRDRQRQADVSLMLAASSQGARRFVVCSEPILAKDGTVQGAWSVLETAGAPDEAEARRQQEACALCRCGLPSAPPLREPRVPAAPVSG